MNTDILLIAYLCFVVGVGALCVGTILRNGWW